MSKLSKYINSFSLHLYAILGVATFILSFDDVNFYTLAVTFCVLLPLILFYLYRIKDMTSEDITDKLGFTGNKFLDPNID